MTGRRYNTSCQPCRTSRIGCDAVLQVPNSCTNCARRGKVCDNSPRQSLPAAGLDFTNTAWTKTAQERRPTVSRTSHEIHHGPESATHSDDDVTRLLRTQHATELESPSSLTFSLLPQVDFETLTSRRAQCVTLHHLLWDIFVSVWDSRAALWLSSSCNPFLETAMVCLAPSLEVVFV